MRKISENQNREEFQDHPKRISDSQYLGQGSSTEFLDRPTNELHNNDVLESGSEHSHKYIQNDNACLDNQCNQSDCLYEDTFEGGNTVPLEQSVPLDSGNRLDYLRAIPKIDVCSQQSPPLGCRWPPIGLGATQNTQEYRTKEDVEFQPGVRANYFTKEEREIMSKEKTECVSHNVSVNPSAGSTHLKIKSDSRRVQRMVEPGSVAGRRNVALRPNVDSAVLSIFYMEFHSRRA